jgi:hypothetical protein
MLLLTVRALRQLGVPVLLASLLLPVMTCMVPGARMSAQERACCRTMGTQCGQTEMPSSHSCCQGDLPGLHNKALEARAGAVGPLTSAVVYLTAFELANPAASSNARAGYMEPPHLGSPLSSVSILRI